MQFFLSLCHFQVISSVPRIMESWEESWTKQPLRWFFIAYETGPSTDLTETRDFIPLLKCKHSACVVIEYPSIIVFFLGALLVLRFFFGFWSTIFVFTSGVVLLTCSLDLLLDMPSWPFLTPYMAIAVQKILSNVVSFP